ncbi:MAG TPA: hypothetical protein VIY90_06815 [Steroidobacteraceae bacterium]
MRPGAFCCLVLLFATGAAIANQVPPGSSPGLTGPQMRADLVYLRDVFGTKDKSFDARSHAAFDSFVNDAIGHVDSLDSPQFALDVARAVAIPHNTHTAAYPQAYFHSLPLRLWWFADGLYVVKAHPDFANLIGARIEKFGELAPQEALRRLRPYISGHEPWATWYSANWLVFLEPLHAIGASTSDDKANITFRLADGTEKTLQMQVRPSPDPTPNHELWAALIPDAKSLPHRWPHALDTTVVPLTYQQPVDLSGEVIGADRHVLYIRSNMIEPIGSESFDQKMTVIQQMLLKERPANIVVDLRLNTGGNFFNTLMFSEGLPRLVRKGGRVLVLVDGVTLSAAIVTAARLKYFGAGRTVFVGSPVADPGGFWAEGGNLTLPNSKIRVSYALQFEDWSKGCDDLDRCYWPSVAFGVKNVSLAPDILVQPRYADYAAGRDPVLAAALARVR